MYDLLRKLYEDPSKLEVLGDGEQVRDYSYVTDTSQCFLLVAENEKSIGEVYNVAGGNPINIRKLVELLIKELNLKKVEVSYTKKSWPGDISSLTADISKIQTQLGFVPSISITNGIHLLNDWLKSTVTSYNPNNMLREEK
jgi:UDP-glucose 4-epimerase